MQFIIFVHTASLDSRGPCTVSVPEASFFLAFFNSICIRASISIKAFKYRYIGNEKLGNGFLEKNREFCLSNYTYVFVCLFVCLYSLPLVDAESDITSRESTFRRPTKSTWISDPDSNPYTCAGICLWAQNDIRSSKLQRPRYVCPLFEISFELLGSEPISTFGPSSAAAVLLRGVHLMKFWGGSFFNAWCWQNVHFCSETGKVMLKWVSG